VDSRVVVWGREFLVGRTESFRVRRQLSKEVTGISIVPQGSVLVPLPFLAYVNDIWRYVDSTTRLFPDVSIIYRKITNENEIEMLQKNLDTLRE